MKNIQLLLLVILTQIAFVQVAQESKSGYDSDSDTVQSFKRRRLDSPVDEQPVEATSVVVPTVADVPVVDQERQDFIKSMTENFYVLNEGLHLLRQQGKRIERFDRFIDKNLEIDTNNENAQINQNRVDLGVVVQRVEDIIMDQMKEPFLKSFTNVIFSPEQKDIYAKISQRRDPILDYVLYYRDTQLRFALKNWINDQDDFGQTLLFKVIASADDIYHINKTVDLLLSLGANPNIQDEHGQTALHQAPDSLPIEVLEVLLTPRKDNVPVNLNIQDYKGITALYQAYMNNKINLFKALYQLGADPTIIDDRGRFYANAVIYEVYKDIDLVLKFVFNEYCQLNGNSLHEKYSLNWKLRQAIIDRNIPLIENLVKQGADVNFLPRQRFIERGIYYIEIFGDNNSNLSLACKLNVDIEIMKILLNSGARPNKVDFNNRRAPLDCPLFNAIKNFNIEAVMLLIEYGADVNFQPYDQLQTPLYIAVSAHADDQYKDTDIRQKIIRLLLNNGATQKCTIVNNEDTFKTPLMYVVIHNRADLLQVFLEYKHDINYVPTMTYIDEDEEEEEDPDLLVNGDTLLHIASRHNHINIARLLLAYKGIDTSTRNTAGQTALDIATTDEMRALLRN